MRKKIYSLPETENQSAQTTGDYNSQVESNSVPTDQNRPHNQGSSKDWINPRLPRNEPVNPYPQTESARPEFIRLPYPGQRCQWTGLSRSALNELILPTVANHFQPPVHSFVLRKPGAKTGIRIIDYYSLASFIRSNPEDRSFPTISPSIGPRRGLRPGKS